VNEQEVAELEAELTEEERTLLDQLADGLAKRRLATAALMFAESVKPLGFIGSQMLHFFRPIISVLWTNPARYDQVTKVLERRGSLELLCRRLEARS
jgi:hypothetical protein